MAGSAILRRSVLHPEPAQPGTAQFPRLGNHLPPLAPPHAARLLALLGYLVDLVVYVAQLELLGELEDALEQKMPIGHEDHADADKVGTAFDLDVMHLDPVLAVETL